MTHLVLEEGGVYYVRTRQQSTLIGIGILLQRIIGDGDVIADADSEQTEQNGDDQLQYGDQPCSSIEQIVLEQQGF